MPGGQPPPIDPGYRPTRGYMRRVRASWPFDWLDLIALLGLLLVGASLYLVWPPLAGVVVGVMLIVYAFYAAIPTRQP
jgi:hypothetical protein